MIDDMYKYVYIFIFIFIDNSKTFNFLCSE